MQEDESRLFVRGNPGTVFDAKSGKLYLFKPHSVAVLQPWPRPMAWRKTKKHPVWRGFRPRCIDMPESISGEFRAMFVNGGREYRDWELREYLSDIKNRRAHSAWIRERTAWMQWYERIPAQIRALVSPYRTRQWHMLAFLARCGSPASDLVISNPALAFALASNWVFHRPAVTRPLRAARALLRRRQSEGLKWLGFPATESARKLIAKIPACATSVFLLLYLRKILQDTDVCRRLAHLPRINVGVARLIVHQQLGRALPWSFVEEVALSTRDDERPVTLDLLLETQKLMVQANRWRPNALRPKSLPSLSDMHDRLTAEIGLTGGKAHCMTRLPPPPGTDDIVRLDTPQEISEEGVRQQHCLAGHSSPDSWPKQFYKVLRPERCTASLIFRDGLWMLEQLRGQRNARALRSTVDFVNAWIEPWNIEQQVQRRASEVSNEHLEAVQGATSGGVDPVGLRNSHSANGHDRGIADIAQDTGTG
jgi:hypothetical protein